MIERIALYRLKGDVERRAFATQLRVALASLPAVSGLSVGLPADPAAAKSWDISIVLRFASAEDEARAVASEVYQRAQAELVEPSVDVAKGWSFELLA
jgi:Stress responsive A/B Barrel Domain